MSEQNWNTADREFGWDDEIQNDGQGFRLLPEGDYTFTVKKFERARHSGSDKIPPCNKAVLTVEVSRQDAAGIVPVTLFLHSKFEWKLCQFFTAIGQRRHGETMRMNWNAVPGACGSCHVGVRTWTGNDGKERENNEITEFYDPAERPEHEQIGLEMPKGSVSTPWDQGGF